MQWLTSSEKQFCGNCGISVMGTSDLFPAGVGLNVRTIQDLDIWGLEITSYVPFVALAALSPAPFRIDSRFPCLLDTTAT
jgi:hypothetical protein